VRVRESRQERRRRKAVFGCCVDTEDIGDEGEGYKWGEDRKNVGIEEGCCWCAELRGRWCTILIGDENLSINPFINSSVDLFNYPSVSTFMYQMDGPKEELMDG